jgi:hypothetical protein
MNQRTKNRKWAVVLFFAAVGLVLGYFVSVLISASANPTYLRWTARPPEMVPKKPSPTGDDFILTIHHQQRIDNLKITYRGVQSGAVVFDLVVMDLDPQYAYLRRIPITTAARGFQLSTHHFKLESAGQTNMQISRTERRETTD